MKKTYLEVLSSLAQAIEKEITALTAIAGGSAITQVLSQLPLSLRKMRKTSLR